MKEAAGEANLTVVAIILIGVVVAVVTPMVNSMMKNASRRACCTDAGYIWEGNKCYSVNDTGARAEATEANWWNTTSKTCNGG